MTLSAFALAAGGLRASERQAPAETGAADRRVILLLRGLKAHLKSGGRLMMIYWSGTGMALLRQLAEEDACSSR